MKSTIQTAYSFLEELNRHSDKDQNDIIGIVLSELVKEREKTIAEIESDLWECKNELTELINIKNK